MNGWTPLHDPDLGVFLGAAGDDQELFIFCYSDVYVVGRVVVNKN